MVNKLLLISCALLMAGCETNPPVATDVVIQEVQIPIAQPCDVEKPMPPNLQFDTLTPNDTLEKKARVLLHDRLQHIAYERKLEAAVESCK